MSSAERAPRKTLFTSIVQNLRQTRKSQRVRLATFRSAVLLLFVVLSKSSPSSSSATSIFFRSLSPPVESMTGVRVRRRFRSPSSVRLFVYTSCACRVCVRACVRAPFPAISSGSVNIFVCRSSSSSSGGLRQ